MPGTTRYSATFDRPYEEDDQLGPQAPTSRRSRSMSWQAPPGFTTRPYTPLGGGHPPRSSSTDNGPSNGAGSIPTRTLGKAAVKAHSNPFQFVKVGTSPLYKKTEDQLKKKEVKKPEVVQEEEEEWQSNLDSWKSRRRKMSEDVFRRQEEIRQFEIEEQFSQAPQKKTKTFSEMVESRAHRGRALSLCLISSPLELQDWDSGSNNKKKMNSVDNLFSVESEENSNDNSEDEGGIYQTSGQNSIKNGNTNSKMNGVSHENGTTKKSKHNNIQNTELDTSQESIAQKDDQGQCGVYIDSGLESISSSHRAGDIPDSGSDFSQDSGSSMDCDSPRVSGLTTTGVTQLLEEYSSKSLQIKKAEAIKNELQNGNGLVGPTNVSPVKNGNNKNTDNLFITNGKMESVGEALVQEKHAKPVKDPLTKITDGKSAKSNSKCDKSKIQERSIESENEMYVDDFEELNGKNVLPLNISVLSSEPSKESSAMTKVVNGNQKSTNAPQSPVASTATPFDTSLNIIYQSNNELKNKYSNSHSTTSVSDVDLATKLTLKTEIPPVEKVAEEMEKLILEQLEEEERAKEMASEIRAREIINPTENILIAPPRQLEPPKEKPPPPPEAVNGVQKTSSLKRVNSTKRIKKEIHKRRSNFLGIENADESGVCDESSVPPPPALQDILKAEMELDRESRRQLESAAAQRLSLEESEIIRKEREIIENLETEERRKLYMGQTEVLGEADIKQSFIEPNSIAEGERIQILKEERKRMEEDRLLNEEQRMRIEEERQLREREEYIKKQEEAIRKERERLRQEQEALQREREEHRQKLLLEQEELMKSSQKPHANDVSVSRIGPPPPAKPTFSPQLTTLSASPNARENATHPSRSHHGAQNGIVESLNSAEAKHMPCHPPNRPNRAATSRGKTVQNETWGQQKVPSVKKQNDSLTESRYNQNHWLIQEAEMRRIAELKERQRAQTQLDTRRTAQGPCSQAHLAEDDSCSNLKASQRLTTAMPSAQGKPSNYAMSSQIYPAEQLWNYGQPVHPNVQIKTYSTHSGMDKLQTVSHPRNSIDPPTKPSRVVPVERQEQMLSVSGRKRCSHCNEELGRGAAMIIESLQLYYHIQCFQCCVCQAQLGNGSCGTDVRVRNNKLHCHNCYSNDEAGLKFSQV